MPKITAESLQLIDFQTPKFWKMDPPSPTQNSRYFLKNIYWSCPGCFKRSCSSHLQWVYEENVNGIKNWLFFHLFPFFLTGVHVCIIVQLNDSPLSLQYFILSKYHIFYYAHLNNFPGQQLLSHFRSKTQVTTPPWLFSIKNTRSSLFCIPF